MNYSLDTLPDGALLFKPVNAHRLEIPWLSQLGPEAVYSNSDCGPACVAMLARWLGMAVTVDQVSQATGLPRGYTYTTPANLIKAGATVGVLLQRDLGLSLEQLRADLDQQHPTIALVHYATLPRRYDARFKAGHWIIITGYTADDQLLYHDPYWPDSTGRHLPIAAPVLWQAMLDCALDGNQAHQGLRYLGQPKG